MNHLSSAPVWTPPPRACDAHFHIFGPVDRFPPGTANPRYAHPFAPLEEYLALSAGLGIERFVFVQPSGYGRDNSCLLDALQRVGSDRARGIVDIDEELPDAELDRMHALGVRGVRINLSPVHPFESGLLAAMMPRIERLAGRCAARGWHLDFLGPGWFTRELLPSMRDVAVDFSVAHMGMFLASEGVQQPGVQELLDALRHGDGRCWVKLTGVYRMSTAPGFADAAPLARAVIEAAPDRVIWGSDFPHLSFDTVDAVELFDLLGEWAPDEATRRRIAVDNPARLYGFDEIARGAEKRIGIDEEDRPQ